MTRLTNLDAVLGMLNSRIIGRNEYFENLLANSNQKDDRYPPFNTYQVISEDETEERFVIEMAVAGFSTDEISISVNNKELEIIGKKKEAENENYKILRQGLAFRSFVRKFHLGEHTVVNGAELKDGILKVFLENVIPEEEKPKIIQIEYK